MHLGFSSLIQHFLIPRSKSSKNFRLAPPPRRRKLLAEPLESRFALSTLTDGAMVLNSFVASDLAVMYTDPAAPVGAPLSDPPPTNPPPTNPLPTDPLPGDPTGTNTAPLINGLVCTFQEGWYVLSGWVSDAQSFAGASVMFSGIIAGTAMVEADSHFTYTFQVPGDFHGEICAVAYDSLGLASNESTVTI